MLAVFSLQREGQADKQKGSLSGKLESTKHMCCFVYLDLLNILFNQLHLTEKVTFNLFSIGLLYWKPKQDQESFAISSDYQSMILEFKVNDY